MKRHIVVYNILMVFWVGSVLANAAPETDFEPDRPAPAQVDEAQKPFEAGSTFSPDRSEGAGGTQDDDRLYRSALGLRAGPWVGLSYKHFLAKRDAIEVTLLNLTPDFVDGSTAGYRMSAAMMGHFPIFQIEHLRWFVGGGLQADYWPGVGSYMGIVRDGLMGGVRAILGVEYVARGLPFAIAVDLSPAHNFVGERGYELDGAISLRYTF